MRVRNLETFLFGVFFLFFIFLDVTVLRRGSYMNVKLILILVVAS